MAGPQFVGGKAISGEIVKVAPQESGAHDTDLGMSNEGLDKFMPSPTGSFGFAHGGGVSVESGPMMGAGTAPGHEVTGPTDLHVGSSMKRPLQGNVYMPPNG